MGDEKVKINDKWQRWLKRISLIFTIISVGTATILSLINYFSESKDNKARVEAKRAEAAYDSTKKEIKRLYHNMRINRRFILRLRRHIMNRDNNNVPPPPSLPRQKKWKDLYKRKLKK